jgi:hypothetical protein
VAPLSRQGRPTRVEPTFGRGDAADVPGPPPVALNARDQARLRAAGRRLEEAEADLIEARRAWAAVVRRIGISAVARELGVSRQAVRDRVLRIERGAG